MLSRRKLLKSISRVPLLGSLVGGASLATTAHVVAAPVRHDYFKELGVRTFINAAGTYTAMTGSLLRDEVKEAYLFASEEYVLLDELQDKVGDRIASLLGCEWATITLRGFLSHGRWVPLGCSPG